MTPGRPIRAHIVSGAGNRFLVLDAWNATAEEADQLGATRALEAASRVDGVLTLGPAPDADFRMQVHNRDGSRARMCGNGLRAATFAAKLWRRADGLHITVRTDAGTLKARWLDDRRVECEVGVPRFAPEEVPADRAPRLAASELELPISTEPIAYALAVGGPHLVVFVERLADVELGRDGPRLEEHRWFPDRANVHFVQRVRTGYEVRTWERGAGATAACGTGAAAITVAGADLGPAKSAVRSVGGQLDVDWPGPGRAVRVAGPIEDEGAIRLRAAVAG